MRKLPLHDQPLHDQNQPRLARRAFVQRASLLVAFAALGGCSSSSEPAGNPAGEDAGADDPRPKDLPSLGGAPDTPEGRAIAAFCDVVVPGKHRDPTGAPGAIDSSAPAMFFDPALPAAPYVGILVLLLGSESRTKFSGREFVELTVDEREQVVKSLIRDDSPFELAIELVKLAFFSSAEGSKYLGYPGANAGYVTDPNFSFGKPMAKEITVDGNHD